MKQSKFSYNMTALEIMASALQQQMIPQKDFISTLEHEGWIKSIDLIPLEIHKGSIVAQGFILEEDFKPIYIIFKDSINKHIVKVIDALITPELAILYVDEDINKWLCTKSYILLCYKCVSYVSDSIIP